MFARSLPERSALDSRSRSGQESPGERASTPGRARAASFQRSGHHNAISVRENGQRPPVSAPTLPPKSRLPAPPPPTEPPPDSPPPKAPCESNEEVSGRLNAVTRKRIQLDQTESIGRPRTPPERPSRKVSEAVLTQAVRPATDQAAATSRATVRGTLPSNRTTTVPDPANPSRLVQKPITLVASAFTNQDVHQASPLAMPPRSSRTSVMSLKCPPITEDSINAAAAQMVKERKGSSSTMASFATSSASLPYPLFSARHKSSPLHRAVSLTSLRRARSSLTGSSRSASSRRSARKRLAYSSQSNSNDARSSFVRRAKSSTSARAMLLDMDDLDRRPKRQSRVAKSTRPAWPTLPQTPGRRKRKGETMSMLIEDGFFPVNDFVYGKTSPVSKMTSRYTSMAGFKMSAPSRLSFKEGTSSLSPISSIDQVKSVAPTHSVETPTTLKSAWRGQDIRGQISKGEDDGGEAVVADRDGTRTAQHHVEIPPKAATAEARWPPPSIIVAPVATQIHLRNGSNVTLTPPELSAWQSTIYLHGPIMLPKPTTMPRKNSVATLDPFQDVVEKLYQDALAIPRRRSDDAVVDDICDFFDAFGFDVISFAGDDFSEVNHGIGEVFDLHLDPESFRTPPMQPAVFSTAEATIASEMLDQVSISSSIPLHAPPVENEETLRARGIARMARSAASTTSDEARPGRRESITLGKPQTSAVLPSLPDPETSMLNAVLQPTNRHGSYSANVYGQRHPAGAGAYVSDQGCEHTSLHTTKTSSRGAKGSNLDDGVEEMARTDAAWSARTRPVAASKEPRLSRMRRLVATASSIL